VIFIETPLFTKLVVGLLSDDEYASFQRWLMANPKAGDVIRDTDGLRKVRWSAGNKGKSGGIRVIYYYLDEMAQIRLLLIYRKGVKDDLTGKEKEVLRGIKAKW
jgi:mRNA-degrading endonuclease RelE of RelBE toxin-antitoxin system